MSIEQKITKSGTYYSVNLTKEQIIFLSAILGNADISTIQDILKVPTFGLINARQWYWDSLLAQEFTTDEFVDNFYEGVCRVSEQFIPKAE